MNEHAHEHMSKREAVARLLDLSNSRHIDEQDVTAIQTAIRSLLKRIFDRERNWKRRHAAETTAPGETPAATDTPTTQWGLWIAPKGRDPYVSTILFATREEAEAHTRKMADYEDTLADEAANGGDANGTRVHEQAARQWRETAVKAFPVEIPPFNGEGGAE